MAVPTKQNLYRKYRPQSFDDLKGQEHIVNTLQAAVSSDRVSHAYMFSGPRGTGKTSMARLLAKMLNCTSPQKDAMGLLDVCRECNNCKNIEDLSFMDIVEIDAASNNGVEDIRQMRERVKYKPVEGKYKVYIIDEVHMLSGSAFNAFLKTLEEPPERVLFILATTDPQKVPATIISRCQCFDFHSVSRKVIQKRLNEICILESKDNKDFPKIDEQALSLIAESAQGGFRDALSLLDQISTTTAGSEVTSDMVLEMTRRLGYVTLKGIVSSIFDKDLKQLVTNLSELFFKGYEPGTIGKDILEYLRKCMLLKIDASANEVLELAEEQAEEIVTQVKNINLEYIVQAVSRLESISMSLKKSLNSRILLETELVKIAIRERDLNLDKLSNRIDELETKISRLSKGSRRVASSSQRGSITQMNPNANANSTSSNIIPSEASTGEFGKFRMALSKKSKICSALLVNAVKSEVRDGTLYIRVAQDFAVPKLNEPKNIQHMIDAANEIYKNINGVKIFGKSDKSKSVIAPVKKLNHSEEIKKIDDASHQKKLKKPAIADAIDVFGGKVVQIKENVSK